MIGKIKKELAKIAERAKVFDDELFSSGYLLAVEKMKSYINLLEENEDAGCIGCKFVDVNEWELPCCKCKRGCKDYWRKSNDSGRSVKSIG